jgi:hypothetical protein
MSHAAKQAEEVREAFLSIDFVVARPTPQQEGEANMLPVVSNMLAKCYNKFLFIAKAMEVGDEVAIWTTIKDAVLSTAHNMTRIQDARIEQVTGSLAYTTKGSMENSLIRDKVKERLVKSGIKKESFFRVGGGSANPPNQNGQGLNTNLTSINVPTGRVEEDDILGGYPLGNTNSKWFATRSSGGWAPSFNKFPFGGQSRAMARGSDAGSTRFRSLGRNYRRGRGAGRAWSITKGDKTQAPGSSWGDGGDSAEGTPRK